MSYVGDPFKHDLFISYSHGATDKLGGSKLKTWSTGLARELESELRVFPEFEADLRIFLDTDLRPGHGIDPMSPLSDALKDDIAATAMLIVLMSPHYLRSTWCSDERDWWFKKQHERGFAADRVAALRIWNMTEPWPESLTDSRGQPPLGFLFYDKSKGDGRPQPFEWPEPQPNSQGPFRDAVLDLAAALRFKLLDWRKTLEKRRRQDEDARKLSDGGKILYLHGRCEHAKIWEKTGNVLSDEGFIVLPTEPDTVESEPRKILAGRDKRVETMSGCDAILLLGTEDGRALSADLAVIGRHDRQSARALSDRLLPCAVLAMANTPSKANRQRVARALDIGWIEAASRPWNPRVQDWLMRSSADA